PRRTTIGKVRCGPDGGRGHDGIVRVRRRSCMPWSKRVGASEPRCIMAEQRFPELRVWQDESQRRLRGLSGTEIGKRRATRHYLFRTADQKHVSEMPPVRPVDFIERKHSGLKCKISVVDDSRTALIVGAGIGGLAAGIALRGRGWNV